MSNTGPNKKLAAFNCNAQMWEEFRHRCQEKGTTATAMLTRFISLYLDGSLDDLDALDAPLGSAANVVGGEDERVKAFVDEYLQSRLPSYLENYNATHQGNSMLLHSTLNTLLTKIDLFVSRLADNTTITRTNTKSTTKDNEREFWFIKERVKYLGLEVNANQIFHIELYANDAFKERHGSIPKKRLFKGSQAFAYPKSDEDILDAAIKRVVNKEVDRD